MINIKIIGGSTRPGRFNSQPVNWIFDLLNKREDVKAEILDLAEVNLPFFDEPISPMKKEYKHEHTKRWSEMVEGADGFIVVTPEYNFSIPAVLKNALDFLYKEWNHKPVTFVSYGAGAGGARAVEHLRGICGELQMYDLKEQVIMPSYWDKLDEDGNYKFGDKEEKSAQKMIDNLLFWAEEMKEIRKKREQ